MTDSLVAVVGAGASGLRVSVDLAEAGRRVTVVERLPATGGQEPEPQTKGLFERSLAAGVDFALGTLAVRWRERRLETLGVEGARVFEPRALVVASGTRPATRGELGLAGDRYAGILPATAAIHLSESGVLVGRRPLIVGGGTLAASCLAALRHAGAAQVTVVAPSGLLAPELASADAIFEGWTASAARGNPRVEAVALTRDERCEWVSADSVLLAHGRIPMRNLEGAGQKSDGVVFCQPTGDPKRSAESEAAAADAANQVLATLEN